MRAASLIALAAASIAAACGDASAPGSSGTVADGGSLGPTDASTDAAETGNDGALPDAQPVDGGVDSGPPHDSGVLSCAVNAGAGPGTAGTGAVQAPARFMATSGSDSGTCDSVTSPCHSLSYIAGVAAAGDTVYIRGGTYGQQSWSNTSGTSSAHITIRSYPGEVVKFDGAAIGSGQQLLTFGSVSYVDLIGPMEFTDTNPVGHGTQLYWYRTAHCLVQYITGHESQVTGLLFDGESGRTNSVGNRVDHVTIYHHNMRNIANTQPPAWGSGIVSTASTDFTVTNSLVYQGHGEGIDIYAATGVTVKGNVAWDNWSTQYYLQDVTDVVLDSNFGYFTGDSAYINGNKVPAIYSFSNELESTHLDNVAMTNNVAAGGSNSLRFFLNGWPGAVFTNSKFVFNTFVNATSANVQIDSDTGSAGNVFENNLVHGGGASLVASSSLTAGFTFSHNAWYGGAAGAYAGTGDVTAAPLLLAPGSNDPCDSRVKATSPVAGAGLVIPGVTLDFEGATRPEPPTIGAFESTD